MPSHQKLAAYARNPDQPLDDMQIEVGMTECTRLTFYEEFQASFIEECVQSGYHTVLLSSEHLSSRLTSNAEVDRLNEFINKIGYAEILVYLRRQDEFLASLHNTRVRLGATERLAIPSDSDEREIFRYRKLVTGWADVFGQINIKIRIFEKKRLHNQDLLDDFTKAAKLGIDLAQFRRPSSENEGLDALLLEFLRNFNKFLPHMGPHTDFRPDPYQGDLLPILDTLKKGKRPRLSTADRKRFLQEFEEENRYIAQEFLGNSDGRLFEPIG
jgi:hypothetical protein